MTVGDALKQHDSLSEDAKRYNDTMMSLLATNIEITSSIPTTDCPHVRGQTISGGTAYELLAIGVKQNPDLANEHLGAALKKVLPLPECAGPDHPHP
jgi:hypothetical protein